jgi:threonine dehydrogenase-like Zn-dependent dehydrogenase
MRAIKYLGDDRVDLVEVPKPEPRAGEALVRITASAICGSERHNLRRGAPTNSGHEAAGIVEAIPDGLAFQPGDSVGLSAVIGCGVCSNCVRGREVLCRERPRCLDGWHAEYACVPVASLRRVPSGADPATIALLTGDALGVPGRGFGRVPSAPGDVVIVTGLGPVGLAHTLVRSFAGARVIAVEPSEYRQALGLKLGAYSVVPPGSSVERGALVIECSGVPSVIEHAFDLVEPGGTVLQSGECGHPVTLRPSEVFIQREVTYTGAWYYGSEDYAFMLNLYERGLRLTDLLTHDLPVDEAAQAYEQFLSGNSGKVVLRW